MSTFTRTWQVVRRGAIGPRAFWLNRVLPVGVVCGLLAWKADCFNRPVSPRVARLEADINQVMEAGRRFEIISKSDLYTITEKAREAERVQALQVDLEREIEILSATPMTKREVEDLQALERRLERLKSSQGSRGRNSGTDSP